MPTLSNLIDEVLLNTEGFGGGEAVLGTLTSGITSADTAADITGGAGFRTGLMEIGDELVYVTEVDASGNITSMVRGFRGTTVPATTAAGTVVRSNPRFPRAVVARAINDTLRSVFPRVFAVDSTEFTFQSATVRYDLPADTNRVLRVEFKPSGPTEEWTPCRRWRFDFSDGGVTGRAVEVWDAQPGQPVRVVYAKPATGLTSGDDFSVTGLPDWCQDLIVLGASWRAMSFLDSGRVTVTSAAQASLNNQQRQETGTDVAKYFLGMFAQRLDEVEQRLRIEYPAVRHYVA